MRRKPIFRLPTSIEFKTFFLTANSQLFTHVWITLIKIRYLITKKIYKTEMDAEHDLRGFFCAILVLLCKIYFKFLYWKFLQHFTVLNCIKLPQHCTVYRSNSTLPNNVRIHNTVPVHGRLGQIIDHFYTSRFVKKIGSSLTYLRIRSDNLPWR